jgi:hypothetical protein
MSGSDLFEGMSSDDSRKPVPGDIVSARYRWAEAGKDVPGEKIRPCLILKVSPDASSVIMAPVSTKQDWLATDSIEIPPEARAGAGLHSQKRSWVKLTEINRVDLPNMAIIPHVGEDGRMAWRRGRVDEATLKRVQTEIAERVNNNTLKGVRVAADSNSRIKIAGVRKISPEATSETAHQAAPQASSPVAPQTQQERDTAIRARALDLAQRRAAQANAEAAKASPAKRLADQDSR